MIDGSGQINITRFRAKVRDFLRLHEDHLSLHKLRRNTPLTEAALTELERMLGESGELDDATLNRSVDQAEGRGLFVRSLVGLDQAGGLPGGDVEQFAYVVTSSVGVADQG